MKAGITGLPFSGKTTLFCALTGQNYEQIAHDRDTHIGTVKVPDERLEKLYEMFQPKKMTHAAMEYFDMAGQASEHGKGMDSKVLQTFKNAGQEKILFWLKECRTPDLLIEIAKKNVALCKNLLQDRPLLKEALNQDSEAIENALIKEEMIEKRKDREYWIPLRKELEQWRFARKRR